MYHVSAQGVDERMINYILIIIIKVLLAFFFILGEGGGGGPPYPCKYIL